MSNVRLKASKVNSKVHHHSLCLLDKYSYIILLYKRNNVNVNSDYILTLYYSKHFINTHNFCLSLSPYYILYTFIFLFSLYLSTRIIWSECTFFYIKKKANYINKQIEYKMYPNKKIQHFLSKKKKKYSIQQKHPESTSILLLPNKRHCCLEIRETACQLIAPKFT